MKHLKLYFFLLILIIVTSFNSHAQESTIEQEPRFPGGISEFSQYISKNLKYPEVADILGLSGKVYVDFSIDKDGSVTDVKPRKCLGAGCEAEAVKVISMSPTWSPGIQNSKPVKVMFTIAVAFSPNGLPKPTELDKLRRSKYGFVFFIKGNTYTVDEAEGLIGKAFDPASIETVENYDNPKYTMPNKKAVYLIVMKNG